MRIIFSLVLLVQFLSLHACNARNLGVLQGDQNSDQHPIFKEKDEKLNPCVPIQPGDRKNSVEAKSDQDEQNNLEEKDDGVIKGSNLWRVPHRKRGEKEAGFNVDYLPPRTHPPVHN